MRRWSLGQLAVKVGRRILPRGVRSGVVRAQRALHLQWPPAGAVRFGSFRRLTPISPVFASIISVNLSMRVEVVGPAGPTTSSRTGSTGPT